MSKEELRKKYFSTGGMVILTLLGIVGLILFFSSGILNAKSWEMVYECLKNNGVIIVFGLFFSFVSFYSWIGYFRNIVLKPKREILFLYEKEGNAAFFLNSNGKSFTLDFCTKQSNKYYEVIKTKDYILEVLEESNEKFKTIPKEKKSYWLNFYSPVGNFERIFLLPIIYVIFLFGFLNVLGHNIFGIIYCVITGALIIYDLIYKIKLANSPNGHVDTISLDKLFNIMYKIVLTIIAFVICFIFVSIFNMLATHTDKLIFLPFLLCGLCAVGLLIGKAFNNVKLQTILNKCYTIIFLIFWFGFITFWAVGIVKQEGSLLYLLFTIPFYLAGLLIVYKVFIKK